MSNLCLRPSMRRTPLRSATPARRRLAGSDPLRRCTSCVSA